MLAMVAIESPLRPGLVSNERPLPFDKDPAQDLARGRFGDLVDELQVADLLVGGDACRDIGHEFLGRGFVLQHDERFRHLTSLLVRAGDHGRVGDGRMAQQDRLQFSGSDLEGLVLDELLEPVDDREPTVGVGDTDIAGVQPPFGVDRLCSRVGLVQVALHDERAAQADLSRLARRQSRTQ